MAEDTLKRRKILIVDDEERMIRFIRLNLEHDGFVVAEAFNGNRLFNACVIPPPT
jgi:DNA-binding response OmpR family regulator